MRVVEADGVGEGAFDFTNFCQISFFPCLTHFTGVDLDFETKPTLAHLLPGELATFPIEIALAFVRRRDSEMRAIKEKRTGKRFIEEKVPPYEG